MHLTKSNKNVSESSLRIIGGVHRGRKLPIPRVEGLRPTSDRTRETLFNWLQFDLPGMRVLDLFAGTGALGLEALSRGAQSAVFVEPHGQAFRALGQSLLTLKMDTGETIKQTAEHYLQSQVQPFDLVFVDPPFSLDLWAHTLESLVGNGWLNTAGFVYLECPKQQLINIPSTLHTVKDKTAGNVRFRLLQMS